MKKILLAGLGLLLAVLMPTAVFAAPKKKSGKKAETEITCAEVWSEKTKEFKGKRVKTFVLDIGNTGTVTADALAAVVPVKTGDKNKSSGGNTYVLVPVAEFDAFIEKHVPEAEGASSSFGGKTEVKMLSAVFAVVGGEDVLLYNIKADALKDFSPSEALEIQRHGEDAMKSERDGFTKKIFNVSKISKKTAPEFKRLVALYNQGKSRDERMKEKEVKEQCMSDDEFSLTVFDEKEKIEWLLRR